MTIKLVRTDALEPTKILLPPGEHVIGRGTLLECDDKHISRLHGELKVNDDSIVIKALHQNPCFYRRRDTNEPQILRLGETITLNSGDRFGLLPQTYWFEVLLCHDDTESYDPGRLTEEYPTDENQQNTTISSTQVNNDVSQVINFNFEENLDGGARAESPSLISNENNELTQVNQNESTSTPKNVADTHSSDTNECTPPQENQNEAVTQDPNEAVTQNPNEPQPGMSIKAEPTEETNETDGSNTSPSVKRPHSPDPGVKKIKTENESEQDIKPGPSDQGAVPNVPPTNNPGVNKPRERCMYGANCYRKNPQHKAQFSHPSDSDWGTGERGLCPYGGACARTDPRHWRTHDHPPGARPPPPPGKKRRNPHRQDTPPDINIVTGKRTRKQIRRPSWGDTDSETEPDPYGTDESDEWEPGSQDFSEDYV